MEFATRDEVDNIRDKEDEEELLIANEFAIVSPLENGGAEELYSLKPDELVGIASDGKTVFAGNSHYIEDTISGEAIAFAEEGENFQDIHVHEGTLFAAQGDQIIDLDQEEAVAFREDTVYCLGSYGGNLVDCGEYHDIMETESDHPVVRHGLSSTHALTQLEGDLIYGGEASGNFRIEYWALDKLGETKVERDRVNAIASHEGDVYDTDGQKVYTNFGEEFFGYSSMSPSIRDMTTAPKNLIQKLRRVE